MNPSLSTLLHNILTSRVYDVARETPLDPAPGLSRRLGNRVLLKREDLQPVFSFKLRGAYNKIAHLTERERSGGIITASAGLRVEGAFFGAGLRGGFAMPCRVSQRLTIAAPHHTWRRCAPVRVRPRKKPKALLPWAESTNGGGGGDNRWRRVSVRVTTGNPAPMQISVVATLLRCNIEARKSLDAGV